MNSLDPKYAARTEARARLDYTQEAVARATRLASTAHEHLRDLEKRAEDAEANNATELAKLIAHGEPTTELPAMVNDDLAQALSAARRDHSVKAKALAQLEAIRAEAEADLTAAERAVVKAVDQFLNDEIVARARHVEDLLNEARRLGTALKYFTTAAGVHSTNLVSDHTLSVLDRLEAPLLDARHVPVDMVKLGDVAAFRDWTARREQMIAGGVVSEEHKAA